MFLKYDEWQKGRGTRNASKMVKNINRMKLYPTYHMKLQNNNSRTKTDFAVIKVIIDNIKF